jgi:thiol-disulfide isomerase/thioredoxin
MRRRALLGAVLLAPAALVQALPAQRGERVRWPESISLLDGQRLSAEQLAAQAVVLVFWSLSCGFCERHNVHIDKLHRAAQGKALRVLGVVRERDAAAVRRFMQARGWQFDVTQDAEVLAAALNSRRSVPMTITVDRQGLLREQIPGEMFEADVMALLKLAG